MLHTGNLPIAHNVALIRYTSLQKMPPFGTFFRTCVCGAASCCAANRKASSDDAEGFFRCCGRLPLKKPSEDAESGKLLNSASSEEVCTYVRRQWRF